MKQTAMKLSHPMFPTHTLKSSQGLVGGCVAQLVAWIAADRGASTG